MLYLQIVIFSILVYGQTMGFETNNSKDIKVFNYDQLAPYLHRTDDTVYLVNFWATWCLPCRKEMPAIQAVEKKYRNDKFKVLLVSLDFPKQLESNLVPYLNANKIDSEVILLDDPDQNRWINLVDPGWSGEIPFTILYGKDFRESYNYPFTYEKLDSILYTKLLKK